MMPHAETRVEAFRRVMAALPSGVVVLAFCDDLGRPRGMTVSSLASVSAEPPSVSMCIGGRASCLPDLVVGRVFAASVLGAGQGAVSNAFAFGPEDPFALFPWTAHALGPPVLDDAPAYLVGRIERIVEHHGTAVILSAVLDGEVRRNDALVYWQRAYARPLTGDLQAE